MSWGTEWNGISTQIHGLVNSRKFYLESSGAEINDAHHFMKRNLVLRAKNIFKIIEKFSSDYKSTLPRPASECLEGFIIDYSHLFFPNGEYSEETLSSILEVQELSRKLGILLTALVLLQSELTSHLSDFSVIAKRLSERAFLHLQRSIIVDNSIKKNGRMLLITVKRQR